MAHSSSAPIQRVPYAGMWLDDFSLTPVPGGALLAGGGEWHRDGIGATRRTSTLAVLWDSAKQGWVELPPLPHPSSGHAAVALPDGRVLLIGGRDTSSPEVSSTLFWEPGTQRFHEGPPLLWGRAGPIAVVLPDGSVLVLGSDFDDDLERGTRAELLRPGANAWEPAGQTVRVFHPGPVCVSGERVVIAGGRDASAEVWDPRTESWSPAGELAIARSSFALTALPDGRAAVSGGLVETFQATDSVEIWDPVRGTWSPGPSLACGRAGHLLAPVGAGVFLVVGGSRSTEIGDPETSSEVWHSGS